MTYPVPDYDSRMITLLGYSGAGKDTFAQEFIDAGWVRANLGDHIKSFFKPFLAGEEASVQCGMRMLQAIFTHPLDCMGNVIEVPNPDNPDEDDFEDLPVEFQIHHFIRKHLDPYARAGYKVSAFSEDREDKALIRGILEAGGELIYGKVLHDYRLKLEYLVSQHADIINTRACMPAELEMIARLEGCLPFMPIEIIREELEPTDWEKRVRALQQEAGYIRDSPAASRYVFAGVEEIKPAARKLVDLLSAE